MGHSIRRICFLLFLIVFRVERFLNDNEAVVGTSMSASNSRHSLRDAASVGTPSPTEIRTEVRRPHSKYSLQKLQEVHDQLYQL